MAQGYVDNETMERFNVFFEAKDEADLKEQMGSLEEKLKGSSTLEHEATGETLTEAREALRARRASVNQTRKEKIMAENGKKKAAAKKKAPKKDFFGSGSFIDAKKKRKKALDEAAGISKTKKKPSKKKTA